MHMHEISRINIASELTMSAVLLCLLVSCQLQRKNRISMKPLSILASAALLLLLCQIVEWALMLLPGVQPDAGVPDYRTAKSIVYTLDLFLSYFSSVAFYYYANEHIRLLYSQRGETMPGGKQTQLIFLVIWGFLATAIFAFCISQSWFFYVRPDGRETFNGEMYYILYFMISLAAVFTIALLIRHRAVLSRISFWLLLLYMVTPTVFLPADLIRGTCLTYLMRAFYTFILYFNFDLRREHELIEHEKQLAIQTQELQELRTQIMLSQMQPHFLYNTLTTISGLCYLENAMQAKQVVDKFAAYFRENMDSLSKEKYIPFERELAHTKTYLWIEKVRFEEALNVVYKIGPTNFTLPSLSLQPLAENAVKHGIRKKKGSGTVTIETRETPAEYQVIVHDDGVGFDPGDMPNDGRSHIGIENITQRLEYLSGGRLEIQSQKGAGTTAVIHLPKERCK